MRPALTFTGLTLSLGGLTVVIAAFIPSLYPVWTARGVNALILLSERRETWQAANWMFAVGGWLTLAGLAGLTWLLDREPGPAAASTAALTAMALASALWTATLAFRLTVTVGVIDAMRNSNAVPEWYQPLNGWAGGLWNAAALLGAAALIGYGLAVVGGSVLPGWTGWVAVGFGVLMLGLFAVTRDVPPILLYLTPTVFGVTALIRAASA